jgi:autotransporter-associated beta strand protein
MFLIRKTLCGKLIAGLAAALLAIQAHAITINITYFNEGDPVPHDENPSWDPDGTILKAHFQAAKAIWEYLLPGGGSYDIEFEWDDDIDPLGLTTPDFTDPTSFVIEMNTDFNWYADADFATNSDFTFTQTLHTQLLEPGRTDWFPGTTPPTTLEVGYVGVGNSTPSLQPDVTSASGFDLLTVILHEIGHTLGINGTEPGEYNIYPQHVGGLNNVLVKEEEDDTILVESHLAGGGAAPWLMDSSQAPGQRVLPSATDVLVIAEDQGIPNVKLARVGSITNGLWSSTSNWIGGAVPGATQDVYIAHGGTAMLDVDAQAKNVKVFNGSNLAVQNRSLYVLGTEANGVLTNGILDFRGATLSVDAGGTIAANLLIGHPSGLTASAGSLVRFNDFATGSTPATAASFNGSVAIGFDNDFSALTSPTSLVFVPSWANWNIGENLIIGDQNSATVIVDNGLWTVNGNATLGKVIDTFLNGGWTGGVTLQNTGAMTIGGNLDVQLGAVTVDDMAALNVAGNITIGKLSGITYRDDRATPSRPYFVAGGETVFVGGTPPTISISGGTVTFEDTANAADATFTVDGGKAANGPGGLVVFKGNSSAGNSAPNEPPDPPLPRAEFRTKGGRLFGAAGNGGQVRFEGTSHANNAVLINEGAAEHSTGTGGRTVFVQNSTAERAVIHNHGPAYINGDAGATHFFNYSTAGSATITNHADGNTSNFVGQVNARTTFYDFSDAGNATIENEGAPYNPVPTPPGVTEFRGNSSAAFSNIHNRAVLTTSGLGAGLAGRTLFYDSATAADATIHTYEGASDHGRVEFRNQSKAGRARIIMENVPAATSNGGYVNFFDNSSAEQSQIFVRAGVCCFGGIRFNDNATAADAQVLTEDGASSFFITFLGNSTAGDPASAPTAAKALFTLARGSVLSFYDTTKAEDAGISLAHGSSLSFNNNSSAGQAQIAASGSSVNGIGGAAITFNTGSLVNNSTITLGGGTASLATGASVLFNNGSHAGNSTITANGGANGGGGATISIINSYGDTAQIIANAGSTVDIFIQSTFNSGNISLGSIEGAGKFLLRGAHLTTGSRNLSTTVSGPIVDNPPGSATGGRLTKVGTGTLTLAGTNTYTGLTTINQGMLNVTGSLAGGGVAVNNGGTLGGTGTIGGLVTVASGAHVAPGNSIGTITMGGGLTTNAGSILDFELGAPSTGDKINVTLTGGLTLLGGTVNLTNAGGLGAGTYTLIDYVGALGGGVGNLALGAQPAGFNYSLVNNAGSTSIDLTVSAAGIPGDYNNNGSVDAADYVVWRKNNGSTNPLPNDPIGGTIGPAQFNQWRANFGQPAGSGTGHSASVAIPEPTTLFLLMVSVIAKFIHARSDWRLLERRGQINGRRRSLMSTDNQSR